MRLLALLLPLALGAVPAAATDLPNIDVQELRMPNGMRFLVFERHEAPLVAAGWVAHVGSVNEREGLTGISHLFEHMMFKGTRTLGTTNLSADRRLLDEQEKVRDQMREEMKTMREAVREG